MFVHLHNHSQYSVLDALSSVTGIAKKAKQLAMPAVAITDHGNMYGAVDFYKACLKEGVKPILGCEVYLAPTSRFEKKKGPFDKTAYHLTLLAKDRTGWKNLCKLSSTGFLEGFYYNPRIDWELLANHHEGLICLSGCMSSEISQTVLNGTKEASGALIQKYRDIFKDDFYLEIQRHEMTPTAQEEGGFLREGWLKTEYEDYIGKQKKLNQALIQFSKEYQIPLVATNDAHYLEQSDWKSHEILLNVQSGEPSEVWELDSLGNPKFKKPNPKRRTYSTHEVYFKSPEEMKELFQDVPEAIANTVAIADKCVLKLDFETKHYPEYVPPALRGKECTKEEREKEAEKYLWELCEKAIPERYTAEHLSFVPGENPLQVVKDRLKMEMSIIAPKGMCDYLLIVWDFIHWAKKQGIPMGPGRGSGAGSIVLYLIGITDIEPLRFHLFFERFINPERISYPDIDVDICMSRREEVINYTINTYGKENVAQIITFGTMKARMAIKDVGRVLSVPLAKVNEITKLIPEDLNITIDLALEKDAELRSLVDTDEEVARVIEIAKRLEGSIRNTGIHAAGLVVSGNPLVEYIPVCTSKDSEILATQFSMKPVEQIGMLKIDFLGLKTLTSIQVCVDAIAESGGPKIDWVNLPLDNKPTFDLLNQGKTMGIFQLESSGMQDLARHLHLDRFEEIIAVVALYRPGPMDLIPSFINRKHGREQIENDHPLMQEILNETYGIMVYQEQVMQIAQKLAGYSLGEGDVLRRAMGKKDHDEMTKQREKFCSGCVKNGIDAATATKIFDKIDKFASYGFNKSHAAAYGYLTYVTAYLKANYPKEWLAALMTCDRDDTTKVSKFIRESLAMRIPVLPPDVNEGGDTFVATDKGIRFAISAIKGIGSGVVETIVAERKRGGVFKSLYEFMKRVDTKRIGKRVVENLVEAGCFDFTGWSRDALLMSVDPMYAIAQNVQKENALGYMNLFAALGDENEKRFQNPPTVRNPTSKNAQLFKEKELLGFFITGHPMDSYKDLLVRLSCIPLRKVEELETGAIFRSAILVETVAVRISSKSQKKFAILTVSDGIVSYELPIWPEIYDQKSHLLNENQLLYAVLAVEKEGDEVKLQCKWLDDLTVANEAMIQECDRAFDKAKQGFQRRPRASPPKEEKQEKKMASEQLLIKIAPGKMRHSHVLQLKALFEAHRGPHKVQIDFEEATLSIDPPWGVQVTDDLQKKVQTILPTSKVVVK